METMSVGEEPRRAFRFTEPALERILAHARPLLAQRGGKPPADDDDPYDDYNDDDPAIDDEESDFFLPADEDLPERAQRDLASRWDGPGWVRRGDVTRADELLDDLLSSPWRPQIERPHPQAVHELLSLAVEHLGEHSFSLSNLVLFLQQGQYERGKKRPSASRDRARPPDGLSAKEKNRWYASAYRARVRDDVKRWLGNVCAGCGAGPETGRLELNKIDGGGERLRRTADGKRDGEGEYRFAHRLGPIQCIAAFDLRHRKCHVEVDRERMREGGRRSGQVRRAKRKPVVHGADRIAVMVLTASVLMRAMTMLEVVREEECPRSVGGAPVPSAA